jgi:hypothetical protein
MFRVDKPRRRLKIRQLRGKFLLRTIIIFISGGVLIGALSACRSPQKTGSPPSLNFWYWHHPFRLSPQTQTQLKQLAARQIWVKAGYLRRQWGDQEWMIENEQEWRTGSRIPLVLAFETYYGDYSGGMVNFLNEHPTEKPLQQAAKELAGVIEKEIDRARKQGEEVAGVQLDIDCPTRLLGEYAALLRALRSQLPKMEFSITALPTWLKDKRFPAVAEAVDYYALMLYGLESPVPEQWWEGELTSSGSQPLPPITNLEAIADYLKQAEEVGRPYKAGLGDFGYGLALDSGRAEFIEGFSWRDIMARGHAFVPPRQIRGKSKDKWEYQMRFRAKNGAWAADDKYHYREDLMFIVSEPGRLREAYGKVRQNAGNHLTGIGLFRIPEAGEKMVLSLDQVKRALGKEKLEVKLKTTLTSASLGESKFLKIAVENHGLAGTVPGGDSLVLALRITPQGWEMADSGDFAGMDYRQGEGEEESRTSLSRSGLLRFSSNYLEPGGRLATGLLLPMNGNAKLEARLEYIDPVLGRRVVEEFEPLAPEEAGK